MDGHYAKNGAVVRFQTAMASISYARMPSRLPATSGVERARAVNRGLTLAECRRADAECAAPRERSSSSTPPPDVANADDDRLIRSLLEQSDAEIAKSSDAARQEAARGTR
ncbi:MAG: hypothetical protein KGL18_17060 [Burkholderiales bacterium]|nr:hypothetical protein [Burkholderiales bacterium]MDE1927081.1 hypothetical protein [Burkholderiales bacterium]MDE2504677.1 hypothetical protein [Burkholderiales bacterium]